MCSAWQHVFCDACVAEQREQLSRGILTSRSLKTMSDIDKPYLTDLKTMLNSSGCAFARVAKQRGELALGRAHVPNFQRLVHGASRDDAVVVLAPVRREDLPAPSTV